MIDYTRKNKKYLNSDDLESTIAHQMLDESDHYLDPYVVRQAIEIALMDQKPKAREIFELHKFEGLTYEEIADYLQISKRSVEDNISKILKQLKRAKPKILLASWLTFSAQSIKCRRFVQGVGSILIELFMIRQALRLPSALSSFAKYTVLNCQIIWKAKLVYIKTNSS